MTTSGSVEMYKIFVLTLLSCMYLFIIIFLTLKLLPCYHILMLCNAKPINLCARLYNIKNAFDS